MKKILRRVLAISLCLFISVGFVCAQNADTATGNTNSIEKTYSIPQTTDTGYENAGSGGSTTWLFIRMILVLALICFIIWFIGRFIKKRMDPGAEPDDYLKKTAQLTLAPGTTIQIVTLRDRAYVLGVSDGSISVIDKIDGKEPQSADKMLIDEMNLNASENLSAKPQDFASMISSLTNSSKRTEDFLKSKRLNLKNKGEK